MSGLKAKISNALNRSPSPSPRNSEDLSSSNNGSSINVEADKYRLLVTAGPSYDVSTHKIVHVNTNTPTYIENEFLRAKLKVRIRGFRGLPSSSPESSPYFEDPAHVKDQYSVAASFVPKQDLPSVDAIWGNDFDHPVRDRLPPGFNTAFKIVKEWIDPGLECDAYADEPWLYGPALSCWFGFHVGDQVGPQADLPEAPEAKDVLSEGASGTGTDVREKSNLPSNNEKRRKHFLSQANRESFTFEKDRLYAFDFFNPYLDFGSFALKLPGFSVKVIKYIDDKSHTLRYVFKNRQTGDIYLCVNFNLLWGEKLEKVIKEDEGQIKALAGAEIDGAEEVSKQNSAKTGGNEPSEPPSDAEVKGKRKGDAETNGSTHSENQTPSTGTDNSNPGLRDKPDWIREQAQRMSISDTLQQTASANRQKGKAGGILDDVD